MAALCAALAVVVYANALHNPFVYDDYGTVRDNPSLVPPINPLAIILYGGARPLVNVTYAIDRTLWGPSPFGFHVTNLALHVINVLLLFRLVWLAALDWSRHEAEPRRRVSPGRLAFATAAIFAVHPMATQAVGYISGRSELLHGTFFLTALLAARQWMVDRGAWWLTLALVAWALGVSSREASGSWPFMVMAYDRLIIRGPAEAWRRRLGRVYAPLVGLAVGLAIGRFVLLSRVEYEGAVRLEWRNVLVEMDVMRRYVLLLIVPIGQTIFHAVDSIRHLLSLRALGAVAWVGLFVAAIWGLRRRHGIGAFGLLWLCVLLVPSSMLAVFNLGEAMSEHRAYLAAAGLMMAVTLVGERLWMHRQSGGSSPRAARRLGLLLVVWLGVLSVETVLRNVVWGDPVRLWGEAVAGAPDIWLPRMMYAEALQAQGRRDEAVTEFERAIALRPSQPDPYAMYGACLLEMGRLSEARAAFERLGALRPRSAVPHNGLGIAAFLAGDMETARKEFERARTIDPRNSATLSWLTRVEGALSASGSP